jgi:transposase-like protein
MPKKSLRKRYSPQQKAQIVLEILREEQSLSQIASTYGVHVTQLRKWRTQVLDGLPRLFDDDQKALRDLEAQHAQERQDLYAEIGRLTTQLGWLKKKSGLDVQSS